MQTYNTISQVTAYLVNGARNQALYVLSVPEYLWEGGAERWCGLHSREADLPNVVTVLEAKNRPDLVCGDALLNSKDLSVEVWHRTVHKSMIMSLLLAKLVMTNVQYYTSPHIFHVGKDKGLVDVKPTSYDVFSVLVRQAVRLFQPQVSPEELLVISHLDHQRHIKHILEVPAWSIGLCMGKIQLFAAHMQGHDTQNG